MSTATKLRPEAHPKSLTAALRRHITDAGLTAYAVSQMTAPEPEGKPVVSPSVVSRFLRGERSLTLETADVIALALNLSLVEVAARRRGPAKRKGVAK